MHKDSFDFVYNAKGDYYDLVVDKKNTNGVSNYQKRHGA